VCKAFEKVAIYGCVRCEAVTGGGGGGVAPPPFMGAGAARPRKRLLVAPPLGRLTEAESRARKGGPGGAACPIFRKGDVRRKTSRRITSFGPADVFVGIIWPRTRHIRSLVANGFG
jgi:hypothetical protein